jgi:hypothetical protein
VILEETTSIDEMDPGIVEPESDWPWIRIAASAPQESKDEHAGENRNEQR